MANKALFVDLHIDQKVGNHFSLLFNVDNFNTNEITTKIHNLIENLGADHVVKVNKFCFYANENRLNPVHVVRLNEVSNLSLVLVVLLLVAAYSKGDELRMNAALGAFEHTNIPPAMLNADKIEKIVATTYYVRDNYKLNNSGVKEDIRQKDLIYREVGRGICIGLYPTHPFQSQTKK